VAAGELRLGLIGLGTVGSEVVRLLEQNADELARKRSCRLRLVHVASRSIHTKPHPDLGGARLSTDPWAVVRDPEVELVIELIGGTEPARSLLLAAIEAGKAVVTANKALLAMHGEEIFSAAEERGVPLGFEASVAGGIPILRTLRESLAADRNHALFGIVNGTCNYILTMMREQDAEFGTALRSAQDKGLAEADPSFDIDGIDAAQKLTLLAMLAFGVRVPVEAVYTEGIRQLSQTDILFAREFGYEIKLLAIAKQEGGLVELRVHPTMVPQRSLLAGVGGAYNAIFVQGQALGSSLYFGRGAGGPPTAAAVVSDILDATRTCGLASARQLPGLGYAWKALRSAPIRPMDEVVSEYYVRFQVADQPGVLAAIAGRLAEQSISIASVIQRGRSNSDASVPLVIRTHAAGERNLKAALQQVNQLPVVEGQAVCVRIEENLG
jgi:homoserine dehydrogenase